MAENPPLNRIYVLGYSANDRDYPIVSLNADPRVAGYKVPEDLSTCPDKRYPNHVFTGAQPLSGDERVRHVWEILPSPWVPFTRYDDNLGPVQGRRRSVKNEGQVAIREADKQVTYEAREGSAIVYTELEETWSIATDDDGNSLFPVRDRDFYDPSRGPVQERRQLFVPTGGEEGSLENVNGVITQTSYEPYNEFLSVKIVQTYKLDGPQLIGKATDNDGQLVTVTTQRKGALDYIPPNPTATRTVEVSREDAESLVERIVDTPEVFKANTFSIERPDPIPQKFRVAVPIQSSQEIVEGTAEIPTLEEGEISKSEEQRNKFIKRISSTSRDQAVLPQTLTGKTTNNERQEVTVTETLQLGNTNEVPTATTTIESEALGDGNYVITKTQVDEVFGAEVFRKTKEDLTPQKFRGAQEEFTTEENVEGIASNNITLSTGEFAKSEQQINKFVKRVSTTSREIQNVTILSEKVLTTDGLVGTRILTLASGDQTFTPSATLVDANVESLGDGRTVKTEVTIPQIFNAKTVTKNKTDLTPEKFKAKEEEETTEENVVGSVGQSVTLGNGEFRKTEQQVTKFVKRVSTTKRSIDSATDLVEAVVTPQGQVATRTLRLATQNQSIQPDAKLIDGSIEALGDGRTIKTEVRVPNVFGQESFSIERPDSIPQKFRVAIPVKTEQTTVEGRANAPLLFYGGELAKSETQQTEFTKRITRSSRDQTELPKSLNQRSTTQDLQLATITETLQDGDSTDQPSATLTIQSEALGDGNYIITKTQVDEVFGAEVFRKTKEDLTPQKFRGAQEESTIEQNIEGIASENIALATGEFSKSEQQINKFVKRVSTTSRTTDVTTTLSESVLTPEGLQATRTLTLSNGPQTFSPRATLVDANVEALGDGRTVKTETVIPRVFAGETFSVERPDPLPQKFRVAAKAKTNQKTEIGKAEQPDLEAGELAKSEQQVTEFVKRTSSTLRDQTELPVTLIQRSVDNDRQKVTVTETLQNEDSIELNSATVTIQSEALGDGNFVVTKSEIPEVFSAESYQKTKADLTPQKFRAAQEDLVFEETIEGQAEEPDLSDNEFSKTEQQINKFVKRVSTTSRSTQATTELNEKVLTSDKIEATRTITLSSAGQSFTPSARLVDANIESLGDGRTVKTEILANETFRRLVRELRGVDLAPDRFKTKSPLETTSETYEETGTKKVYTAEDVNGENIDVTEFFDSIYAENPETEEEEAIEIFNTLYQEELSLKEDSVQAYEEIANLQDGEISKTIESINPFVKRKTTTFRDLLKLPISLTTQATNDQKLIVTTTETLRSEKLGQLLKETEGEEEEETEEFVNEEPTATIDYQSEDIGDGTFLIRKIEIPEVFPEKIVRVIKEDLTPLKFRAAIPQKITEETVALKLLDEGEEGAKPEIDPEEFAIPSLEGDEIEKTERFISKFTKRKSLVERLTENEKKVLYSTQFTTELGGGIAQVYETYDNNLLSGTNNGNVIFGTVSDTTENLGNGKFLRKRIILNPQAGGQSLVDGESTTEDTLPILSGQEYDESLDIVIPYKQFIARANGNEAKGERRRVSPRDVAHSQVIRYDVEEAQNALENYYWVVSDMVEISLPPKLISVLIGGSGTKATSFTNSTGDTYLTQNREVDSVDGDLAYEIEDGFRGVIPASRAIFFLPKESSDPKNLLLKVQQNSGADIQYWPNVKTKGYQITLTSESQIRETSNSVSFDSASTSQSTSRTTSTKITTIPPTLHERLPIEQLDTNGGTVTASPNEIGPTSATVAISWESAGEISTGQDVVTGKFPTGRYIYRINCTPYRFSYTRVEALIVDITNDYV